MNDLAMKRLDRDFEAVSFSIVHFTFVICHCRNHAADGDDK
jgi:hypothetical protein